MKAPETLEGYDPDGEPPRAPAPRITPEQRAACAAQTLDGKLPPGPVDRQTVIHLIHAFVLRASMQSEEQYRAWLRDQLRSTG